MSELSGTNKAILEATARALAAKEPAPDVEFQRLNLDDGIHAVIGFLATRLEEYTEGKRTVRRLDYDLAKSRPLGGAMLFAAECDTIPPPPDRITELSISMRLILIMKWVPGLKFDLEPASEELVLERRKHRAEAERRCAVQAGGQWF